MNWFTNKKEQEKENYRKNGGTIKILSYLCGVSWIFSVQRDEK